MINAARRNSKYLLSGNSDFNGVRIDAHFYKEGSKKPELLDERSVYAYIAEDGTIQSEKTDIDSVRGDVIRDIRLTKKFNDGMVIGSFLMIIVLLVGMIVTLFLKEFRLFRAISASLYFSVGVALTAPILTHTFLRLIGNERTLRFCRFHAAEHAVINAYHDLGRVPTLSEIKEYSIFAYNCGATEQAKKGWLWFGISILVNLPGIWLLIYGIIFLAITVWAKFEKYFFLQAVAIKKPTDREYLTAIAALEEVLKPEEHADETN